MIAETSSPATEGRVRTSAPAENIRHIAACLDRSVLAERALAHAVAVAKAFDAHVSLLHVLDTSHGAHAALTDPLEWELARREASAYLEQAARGDFALTRGLSVDLVEGDPPTQIAQWVREHDVDLVVLCTHGRGGATEWPLASTARKLVESLPCSLLVVPAVAEQHVEPPGYTRILVPLDGSVWSETVLSLATRLAQAHGAELVLAHAVPRHQLTRAGPAPPSAVDLELERRLVERNEGIGRGYLEQLRARLMSAGISTRTVVERDGEVRADLLRVVAREQPDIIVLSTCGSSGHVERVAGTVAMHLLTHATRPLLLARPRCEDAADVTLLHGRTASAPRLPTQATP